MGFHLFFESFQDVAPNFPNIEGLSCLQCNAVSSGRHVFKNVSHIVYDREKSLMKELHSGLWARGIATRAFGSQPGVRIISTFLLVVFPFSIQFANFLHVFSPPLSTDNFLKTWLNDSNSMRNLTTLFSMKLEFTV